VKQTAVDNYLLTDNLKISGIDINWFVILPRLMGYSNSLAV